MFRIQRMRSVGNRNRTVGVFGYPPSWTPANLPSIAPSLNIAISRASSKLWQDVGKTVPAVANNDPVYVATCPYTGFDWVAPSNAERLILTNISGAKWGLTGTLAAGGLLGPTQSTQANACTFSLRANETDATNSKRIVNDSGNALMCPRRTSVSLYSLGNIFAGQLINDSNPHTTTMIKPSAGGNWTVWLDGVSQSVTANTNNFGRLSIGRAGAIVEGYIGVMSAFITTSTALSAANQALLETYLSTLQ